MTCLETWTGPGTAGWWTDPAGRRHWMYPDDRPIDVGGHTWLLRVCRSAWQPIFGGTSWHALLADPLGDEPFNTVGYLTAPHGNERRWKATPTRAAAEPGQPVGTGLFDSRHEAVVATVAHAITPPDVEAEAFDRVLAAVAGALGRTS